MIALSADAKVATVSAVTVDKEGRSRTAAETVLCDRHPSMLDELFRGRMRGAR